jgi:trimeric autotransporter adhesin
VFNSKLYFKAYDGTNGYELWSCDASNTCAMVINSNPGSSSSSPSDLTVFNSKLYFSANDGTNGAELWMLR